MDHARRQRCGDDRTVEGWRHLAEHPCAFQPDGIRWLQHLSWHFGETTQVRLPERIRAGPACRLSWNSLPPEQLLDILSAGR
jgi:hypothetical protein